jgi:hypothetical protein
MKVQRMVCEAELQHAIDLFRKLIVSQRSQARAEKELQKVLARTPSLSPKLILREQRRIGVGYRDKGSLRFSHEDHEVPPRVWWWEDIAQILHLKSEEISSRDFLAEEDMAQSGFFQNGELVGIIFRIDNSPSFVKRFPRTMSQSERQKSLERFLRQTG